MSPREQRLRRLLPAFAQRALRRLKRTLTALTDATLDRERNFHVVALPGG